MKSTPGTAREVFLTFLQLGLTAFGGPTAHIGYFRRALVERRAWLSDAQFTHLLALCQFLPGPASSQLGFALGYERAGWRGAMAAFCAFTLPSAVMLFGFAQLALTLHSATGEALFKGLKLVAVVIVADALWGMSRQLCNDTRRRLIGLFAFGLLMTIQSGWAQWLVILLGALSGALWLTQAPAMPTETALRKPGKRVALILAAIAMVLLAVLPLLAQNGQPLFTLMDIFYRAGALVFGGGHVVLPLLEAPLIGSAALSESQFLTGYGIAQAVPGPLFTVAAFYGALFDTGMHSVIGATVALAAIFLPGFLLLAAVLPYWQRISAHPQLTNTLAGVNAAVVGILAAAWINPVVSASVVHWTDGLIALAGFAALRYWRLSPLWIIAGCVGATLGQVLLSA
ncbi:chromate efflux transporter [Aestuariibacter halophilus]|uniref:Chromate efflux transporter n=2 Tax=Fluctibacter halophilus TaxID=226011 RepID=A0ABS8GEL3_9ALTE|nr:chromate efflux transporter [Aestuariibacter halophilus]